MAVHDAATDAQTLDQQGPLVSVRWLEDGALALLDQRLLPESIVFMRLESSEQVWHAIRDMAVRGAPAIGIAAAYGLVLGVQHDQPATAAAWLAAVEQHATYLATSRPTAVNLFWALDRMRAKAAHIAAGTATAESEGASAGAELAVVQQFNGQLLAEAQLIQAEDEEVCRSIGEHALTLFHDDMGVLTHCNAGGLATARYGTALAPMYLAQERGMTLRVFADETRPVLQGARLTAFELMQAGIDVTLICDNMAAMVMQKGWVQAVIVGTDRVAANGDVANKIGTYGLAILAKAHGIPFYVACPTSTIDLDTPSGDQIPIEERSDSEVTESFGKRSAPQGVKVFNPAFDVTPNEYVSAIITEHGVLRAPYDVSLQQVMKR
ncbi:S-methyl-5-thioribose-1-phosphate isomerase [Paenibacillus sp. 481]|uniref:S-methyl-5-thioribose-1-phosphate isomerase n=1 Tax=Paenibacillus sp. 481 TaxID=2835869 RepID=UPI001E3FA5C7|nr:S-methyl-5-thioribose-1-phosphate isomerase [Paenibacillus sp. 481]UHA76139.1 S-methyl-5-thioribose-1-phosphate isomerase [Paenibacillus sp. 481]